MLAGRSDVGKASAHQWDYAVFGAVCALMIGFFAWSAEPGFLELQSPRAEDSYYNLLVQGFRTGQLNLKREVPPGFAQLADPYDPVVFAAYKGDVRYPLGDLSYYKGKLYLYFGVTPALVLFWPYVTLTGNYLSDKEAVVIFFALGFLVAAGLLRAVWRRYFPEASIWVVAGNILVLGLTAGTLGVVSLWCDVYEVAISCGFAFTMLALAAIWCAWHEPKQQVKWLLWASLAYGLAVGARPSLLFGIIILLMPVARAWHAVSEPGSRRRVWLLLASAVCPAMLIGLGLALYNILRFNNPFEFGWLYQLQGGYQPNTAQQFSLHYLWFNFRFYFLEPMQWSSHFPFVQTLLPAPLPPGYFGAGKSYGGIILMNYPLVWLALAAPLVWGGGPVKEVSILRWFVATVFLLFVICALTICLFFSANSRYELDFLPTLMLLAVIGILALERTLVGSPVWRCIVRWGWCLLLACSIVFNLLASVEALAEANYFAGNFLVRQGRADEALGYFQKALSLEPKSAAFHGGLGSAFYQDRRFDEAIVQCQEALEINPDFAEAAGVHNNLGYCYLQTGRMNEAVTQFQKALEIKPNFAEAHYNLGSVLLQSGRVNEAIAQFREALEFKPDFAGAHYNLGLSLLQKGQLDEAITQFQKSLEIQQNYSAYYNLGHAFYLKKMTAEAMASYQRAVQLQPHFIPAQIDLAWMLATWPEPAVRNGAKAVALAEEANQFSQGKDPLILRTLAAAYAEAGRFSEAVATAKQALALAAAQSKTGLMNELQTEIGLYESNSPCRSTNN
jgi:tetratricopeptide (TPR) repeat protein